jgi:hypothetical protein
MEEWNSKNIYLWWDSSASKRKRNNYTRKHRVDQFERLINLFTDFGAGQNNLSTDENQEDDLSRAHIFCIESYNTE